MPLVRLAAALENVVARDAIKKALGEMLVGYGGRGVVLEEVAGGYQLRTPKEHALYVRKLLAAKPPRLSRPLLETLAIIAYRQPVTRPEIEQLRGVDSGGVLETLLERRLVRIDGRKEAPGRPIMYATSPEFLEIFGLRDLDGLPDLEEFKELEERGAQEAADPLPAPSAGRRSGAASAAPAPEGRTTAGGDDWRRAERVASHRRRCRDDAAVWRRRSRAALLLSRGRRRRATVGVGALGLDSRVRYLSKSGADGSARRPLSRPCLAAAP